MLAEKIDQLKAEVQNFQPRTLEELEEFRIHYLGRKGAITELMQEFKALPKDEKKNFGKAVNELKAQAQALVDEHKERLEEEALAAAQANQDLTLDPAPVPLGARHPVSIVIQQMNEAFRQIGFEISDGPELVDDWHNFTALNIPD